MPAEVVHVIDDDADVRQSLAFLLTAAGFTVRVHESAVAFLAVLAEAREGCVVTDIRMPQMNGLELQRRLGELKAGLPVIVMTGHGDVPLAVEAMKLGAVDFLEKPFDDDLLISMVDSGLKRAEPEARQEAVTREIAERIATLSPRERQVMDGLVAGLSNKSIAREYDISPRTIEVYRANVMTKMQAGSLSELVRLAMRAGALKD